MLSKKIKSKIKGFIRKFALIPLYRIKLRHAQEYKPPQDKELEMIEQEFINSGIKIHQFYVDKRNTKILKLDMIF